MKDVLDLLQMPFAAALVLLAVYLLVSSIVGQMPHFGAKDTRLILNKPQRAILGLLGLGFLIFTIFILIQVFLLPKPPPVPPTLTVTPPVTAYTPPITQSPPPTEITPTVIGPRTSLLDYYFQSGEDGDPDDDPTTLEIDLNYKSKECSPEPDCIRIEWRPGPRRYVAINWLGPAANYGSQPGYDLNGATQITYWLKSEQQNAIVDVRIGCLGSDTPVAHPDSVCYKEHAFQVGTDWTQKHIDLAGQSLNNVVRALAIVLTANRNPNGATLYLKKDIWIDGIEKAQPAK